MSMKIIKYPSDTEVQRAFDEGEPMLVLISFDGETVIMSGIDEAVEHHNLLIKAGMNDRDIDKYFCLVLDDEGADWTFVCPPDYKGIEDRQRRISTFYKDGISVMRTALKELGMEREITIPKRYRRHFDYMLDG